MKTRYNYSPFGDAETIGEASGNPFQYTGRENDRLGDSPEANGTGLYYYRARYYSPELGRFISEDPIGLLGGINYFAYVGNSPCNFTDPMGLQSADEIVFAFTGGSMSDLPPIDYDPFDLGSTQISKEEIDKMCKLVAKRKANVEYVDSMLSLEPPRPGQFVGAVAAHGVVKPMMKITPYVVGLSVTVATENPRAGFTAYEVTEMVIGIAFDEPAGLPGIPISPLINPSTAE